MIRYLVLIFLISLSFPFAQIKDSIVVNNLLPPDSLSNVIGFLLNSDTFLTKVKRDSIVPIYSSVMTAKSFICKRQNLLKLEYRYAGDYLRLFPFNFIKDLGFPGQPNESFLYGVGNSAISYLLDGVSYNDRYYNTLNLNLIQSEDIDSIEIIPLPRGFLYGAYNNPVSINFITRDFISRQPYSRIKYYQGPNRETMIDGSFNLLITNKLTSSFEITNRITDSTFRNSKFSIWQGKIKLKYLLSNDVNIIASYNYNDYKSGYSGGVDVDSIVLAGQNINNVLYDFIQAPVLYPNGEIKTLTHLPRLRFLIKPTKWLKTDASLFFLFTKNEKNDYANEYSENKTYGLNIRNDIDYRVFKFQLNVDYEKQDVYSSRSFYNSIDPTPLNAVQNKFNVNLFSVSGILSANLDDGTFIPSIFYKTSSNKKNYLLPAPYNDNNYSQGFGVDLLFKIKSNLDIYIGTSLLKPYNSSEHEDALIELGAKYQNEFVFADLKYFYNEYSYGFYTGGYFFDYIRFGYLNGLGLTLKFNYWKLLLESNSSYYYSLNNRLFGAPDFQTQTGLYYSGKLFNDNLDLKTGFVFYYTGKNNVFTNEHGVLEVPSSNKLDFTLAGEIQKTAIIYFTWQNLFDNNYYITPYYPMPSRSIRFGVAWELFN